MTKNINAYALAKGFRIIKVPVRWRLPIVGHIELPTWLTYQTEYCRKRCVYSVFGMAQRMAKKMQKKARKLNQKIQNPYQ